MTEAHWKLATWFSPAYPVGAYTYSHGIETALAEGRIGDAASAGEWIRDCLEFGAGRSDAILLASAWRAVIADDTAALDEIRDVAEALQPSRERLLETGAQGAAFAEVTAVVEGTGSGDPTPYPVAVGCAAAAAGIPLPETVLFYLHAMASNLVSACIRLVPLGQTDGQRVLATAMPLCQRLREAALAGSLDDLGGCAVLSDITSMHHETQAIRLFRT